MDTLRQQVQKALLSFLADAKSGKVKAPAKAKGKRGNPEALKRWREEQKATKAAPAKAAPKRKGKAKATPKADVEGVECGGIEFRKGSTTKQGREYVLLYVGGAFAGSLRVDDGNLLGAVLGGLRHKDAADAIALATE